MKKSVKQQQAEKVSNAQLITLCLGMLLMLYSIYQGSTLSLNNPLKEGYLIILIFSMLVINFSIFSIYSNNNK